RGASGRWNWPCWPAPACAMRWPPAACRSKGSADMPCMASARPWTPDCATVTGSNCCGRYWWIRRRRAGDAPASVPSDSLLLVGVGVQVAEARHPCRQLLVLLREIVAFPAGDHAVLEVHREIAHLDVAEPVGALGGGVVPAVVVERIGDRRRAQQHLDLLLAHARLELVHGGLLHQGALVDRLLVDDAATGGRGRGEGGEGGGEEGPGHADSRKWGKRADNTRKPQTRGRTMESQELRKAGLKVTHPRMRILALMDEIRPRHMTAEDIYRHLLEQGDEIGLATVYRVLTQFEAAGLVLKHNFEGGQAVYELDRGEHHDHMVDVDT